MGVFHQTRWNDAYLPLLYLCCNPPKLLSGTAEKKDFRNLIFQHLLSNMMGHCFWKYNGGSVCLKSENPLP